MTNTNNIYHRGPGAFKIALGVFLGLFSFTAFIIGLIAVLFTVGVLDVAGVL